MVRRIIKGEEDLIDVIKSNNIDFIYDVRYYTKNPENSITPDSIQECNDGIICTISKEKLMQLEEGQLHSHVLYVETYEGFSDNNYDSIFDEGLNIWINAR